MTFEMYVNKIINKNNKNQFLNDFKELDFEEFFFLSYRFKSKKKKKKKKNLIQEARKMEQLAITIEV